MPVNSETGFTKSNEKIVVGLDIGTSKVCSLVASPDEKPNSLNILGIGIAESEGLNRGVVVNIDKTIKSIRKVVDQAEQQAGIEIKDVVVGIAGDHIDSFQTKGTIGISNENREITKKDVERVIEESRKVKIPSERKILHVLPQDFIIDGQDGITDPVGMSGVRMEANVHVVTGSDASIQNIHRCVERAGLNVQYLVLEPLASSYAVLDNEEKEVGVALIDIGGGTTDIAIFEENLIRFTSVIAIGGKHVTNDIRKVLGIIVTQAERIKKEYGHTHLNSLMQDEIIMIPGIGGRSPIEIPKSQLTEIIQARMEEIFGFALSEIRRSGFGQRLGAGIVITGGCSLLNCAEELAQDIFGMPVKIGIPSGISYSGLAPEIENPIYSTSVGLALYGLEEKSKPKKAFNKINNEEKAETDDKKNIFSKFKNFLEEI
jgi:cell division protein FtsA